MNIPFLNGNKIFLREATTKDANIEYLTWINDYDVVKNMTTGLFPTSHEDLLEYLKKTNESNTDVLFAIIDKKEERHIGNVKLGEINWIHRHAYLGVMIGNKKYWGKGHGKEACELLLWYAFNRLNMHKVSVALSCDNIAARKIYDTLGFKLEGTRKKHVFKEGKYNDDIIMGILEEEYFLMEK